MTAIDTDIRAAILSGMGLAEDDFALGLAAGLRTALDILTRETARQEHRGRVAQAENPLEYTAAQHVYAAHVLNDAAKQVAAEFRRGAG
jgi:hypothetical protein